MSRKEIVFLPYKIHFRFFLCALAKRAPVTVMLPPEKALPEDTHLGSIRMQYLQFGANLLKPLVGSVRTLKYVSGFKKLFKGRDIGALIPFEYYHWYTFQCIAYKKRNPHIKLFLVSETKRWPRNPVAFLLKRLLFLYFKHNSKHFDAIFAYTKAGLAFMKQQLPNARILLLPSPTDVTLFTVAKHKPFLQGGTLHILLNARYSIYKRHKDVFEALVQLRANGKQVQLTCISREELRKKEVMQLAYDMGVSDLVTFVDPVSPEKLPMLYASCDLLVLPSYNEAIGMVVPEAMACGTPTITSDTVGANVYVLPNVTGFIYETGNVSALTTVLEGCFDARLLERMGENARRHILEHFTPDAVVNTFLSYINIL